MAIGNGLSFIFDTSKNETPESLARKRALAAAIMGNIGNRPARNAGEGIGNALASIGQGIQVNVLNRRADAAAKAGQDSANAAWNPLLASFGGQQFPSAPGADGNVSSDAASDRVSRAFAPLGDSQEAFVSGLAPAALEASKRTGVDPRIIIAQAAQETGWGKHAPGNNYFGVKSHGKSGGQNLATTEYINGKPVRVNDSFRGYASPADSVSGYADFLLQNPRYKPMMQAHGLDAQLQALGASGYATDPNYANSVGSIARSINLPGSAADATEAMATGQPIPQAPQQVASLDPSAGMDTAQAAPPLPVPRTIQDVPVASAPQPTQTAQAQPSAGPANLPVMAGGSADAIQSGQAGPSLQVLMQAAQNPWLNETQRGVIQMMLKQRLDPNAGLDAEYRRAQIKNIESEIAKRNDPNAREKFGNSVIWGQNDAGDWVAMQPSSGGGLVPAEVPNGVKLSPPGMSNLNLGTQYGMRDRNGQVINTVPIDNTGKARDTAIGTQQGAQLAAAPGDIVAAQNALDLLDSIRSDPYLDRGTGLSSLGNAIPGTGGYDFANKVQGAKSGGFLTAIQQMRGLGSLSDAEGRAATSAVNRMNTSTSKEEFLSALNDYEKIVKQGLQRAQDRLGGNFTSTPTGKDDGDWNDLGNGVKIRVKP